MESTMRSSIIKGSSFLSQRVDSLSTLMTRHDYSIVVGMQIPNATQYDLNVPKLTALYGFNPKPPTSIPSGVPEVMVGIKYPNGSRFTHHRGFVTFPLFCYCYLWLLN